MSSPQRRTFSNQFKLETVLEYLRGHKPSAQICRERDITENLLYRRKQQFYERALNLLTKVLPILATTQRRSASPRLSGWSGG